MKTLLFLLASLLVLNCQHAEVGHVNLKSPWIQKSPNWETHVGIDTSVYSNSGPVLHFDSSGCFNAFYWFLYQHPLGTDSLQLGAEGGINVRGTWTFEKDRILVRSRVVERVIRIVGEVLPGPLETDTVSVFPHNGDIQYLIFKSDTFVMNSKFDERSLRIIKNVPSPGN